MSRARGTRTRSTTSGRPSAWPPGRTDASRGSRSDLSSRCGRASSRVRSTCTIWRLLAARCTPMPSARTPSSGWMTRVRTSGCGGRARSRRGPAPFSRGTTCSSTPLPRAPTSSVPSSPRRPIGCRRGVPAIETFPWTGGGSSSLVRRGSPSSPVSHDRTPLGSGRTGCGSTTAATARSGWSIKAPSAGWRVCPAGRGVFASASVWPSSAPRACCHVSGSTHRAWTSRQACAACTCSVSSQARWSVA